MLFIAAVAIFGGGWGDSKRPLVIDSATLIFAHRGIAMSNPENTYAAFQEACNQGFNCIETDISITKDLELVLFHDGNEVKLLQSERPIDTYTMDDLQTKSIYWDGKKTEQHILSLALLLDSFPKTIFYLDMKVESTFIAELLNQIITKKKAEKRIIIASSNFIFLSYLRKKNHNLMTCLEGFKKRKEFLYYIIPSNLKPDYYSSFLSETDSIHVAFFKNKDILNRKIIYGITSSNIHKVKDLGIGNYILDYDDTQIDLF